MLFRSVAGAGEMSQTAGLTTGRVIIIGAGLGALYAALELAPRPVLVISPEVLGVGASSAWAQGGVAAAMASNDCAEAHALDTMRAGAGTVDAAVARMVTGEARRHILDLTSLGTPFDRDAQGDYVMSREAAHGIARVVRVKGDQAGREIMQSLIVAVRAEACARAGIDPVHQAIPVVAAAHYHMGGVATGTDGRASLRGLWVCGEAASTGLHGANRLASNGLLEALVYARICAREIRAATPDLADQPEVALVFPAGGEVTDAAAVARLRQLMTDHVGVLRDAAGLRLALAGIAAIEAGAASDTLRNMTATATLIAAAALLREESRGAHFRTDFPQSNPALAQRSHLTLARALEIRCLAQSELT